MHATRLGSPEIAIACIEVMKPPRCPPSSSGSRYLYQSLLVELQVLVSFHVIFYFLLQAHLPNLPCPATTHPHRDFVLLPNPHAQHRPAVEICASEAQDDTASGARKDCIFAQIPLRYPYRK
jgi:hypothetical protein